MSVVDRSLYVILSIIMSIILSIILSFCEHNCRITHERVYGCLLNTVGVDKE